MATQPLAQPVPDSAESNSLLQQIVQKQAEVASRYQPVMGIEDMLTRFKRLQQCIREVLVENEDYGRVPGVEKPFLFKSGAQKLCMLFGYVPHYEPMTEIEEWDSAKFGEPLFYYKYQCCLYKDGAAVGEGIGSANSWESKYRYRWVSEDTAKQAGHDLSKLPTRAGTVTEFVFAVDKAETSGRYGKPKEYWDKWHAAIASGEARKVQKTDSKQVTREAWEMGGALYRVPNPDFTDVINTCQKQGEKRAYVEATLSATGASQFFTQDEDAVAAMKAAEGIDTGGHPVGTQAAADHVAQEKIRKATEETAAKLAERAKGPSTVPAMTFDFAGKETDVPTELIGIFRGIDGLGNCTTEVQAARVKTALTMVEKELVKKRGRDGGDYYERLTKDFHASHPVVTMEDLPALKVLLYKLWLEANKEAVRV
jgi:hypothetical protein